MCCGRAGWAGSALVDGCGCRSAGCGGAFCDCFAPEQPCAD
ncbi:MAG: hypothetical protein E6G33_04455 [Actinobacteria bacterium]|nr:MAG: hypothetical protein E6G33_04455 [Actinomycetota bacterium]